MRALVAVVRVTPDTVLSDIDRLVDLGGAPQALTPGCTTILKDNISWHFPFPAANVRICVVEAEMLRRLTIVSTQAKT